MESKVKNKKIKTKIIKSNIIIEEDDQERLSQSINKINSEESIKEVMIKKNEDNLSGNSDNSIELTPDQIKVHKELIEFIKNESENQLLLVGYAGTGKTTMVTKIIFDLLKENLCQKIVIAAPTHKAVNIAKSKLFLNIKENEELSSNINIIKINILLNYK